MERQQTARCRDDLATHRQHAVQLAHGLLEVAALDGGQRREQQVADRMAARPPALADRRRVGVSTGNRYWSSSLISGSASASAAMQLRMSPTGGMPSSVRNTPDEPPSSATVTIAVRLLVCSLSPRRSVDRPVPPPIATTRGPRARNRFW